MRHNFRAVAGRVAAVAVAACLIASSLPLATSTPSATAVTVLRVDAVTDDIYTLKAPVTPSYTARAPYERSGGRNLTVVEIDGVIKGNVEIAKSTLEVRQNGRWFTGPSPREVFLDPGAYTLISRVTWRGYVTEFPETRVLEHVLPAGTHRFACTIAAANNPNYELPPPTMLFVTTNCGVPGWDGTIERELYATATYNTDGAITGWRMNYGSGYPTVVVPAVAGSGEPGGDPVQAFPTDFTFTYQFTSRSPFSAIRVTKETPVWVPGARVNGPWQTSVLRTQVNYGRAAAPEPQLPPDGKACASARDLAWITTDASQGYRKVARIIGNPGVEVASGYVDSSGAGSTYDVYQRTRWYKGCNRGTYAEIRFWGATNPRAAGKRMLH